MKEPLAPKKPAPGSQPGRTVSLIWLIVGICCPVLFIVLAPPGSFENPLAPMVIYLVSALGLDLLVGTSRSEISLQRITPAVVLALLLTPGLPLSLALMIDLICTIALVLVSRINNHLLAQSGKALLPASLTAFFLYTRSDLDLNTYFFACEIFIVVSLLTRTSRPPFRSDVFLVVSYPAIALLLRFLAELHLTYVLLAVPLLILLTTVDTETLLRYFQLKKKLHHSQSEIQETRRAQRQSEIESRRKGVLLSRKELQLTLLNGLGREMDAAQASDDLGHFLLKESVRLTEAESALVIFTHAGSEEVLSLISTLPANYCGVKEGGRFPANLTPGISPKEPWSAPIWRGKESFLSCKLGHEGWLFLAKEEREAFPPFLEEFFSAVGRHAGSAVLALRRLTEVRAMAQREAQEKKKVAEQNRNLRLLIDNFEGLAEGALASNQELVHRATIALKHMTGADEVIFQAPSDPKEYASYASYIFCPGTGASGNLLCLSSRPKAFIESQVEWCTLLRDFLDKTMENSSLHREVQSSYLQLKRTQEEVVVSSQWAAAGRLAANAAHELNTPLGAIRIAAEHISEFLQKGGDAEPAVESMDSLLRSVDRCRQVTDRLLLTSRPVDMGANPTKPQIHGLSSILKNALASVQPYLRASRIKLVEQKLDKDYQVLVVMQDLYWAIVNILKNSIDALNDNRGQDKRITISLETLEDSVRLSIHDNGPGISEEVKKRLFEPFFTTKKLGQGNGLGLSMSQTNLRRWGGDIAYEESPQEGATFVLTVPLIG